MLLISFLLAPGSWLNSGSHLLTHGQLQRPPKLCSSSILLQSILHTCHLGHLSKTSLPAEMQDPQTYRIQAKLLTWVYVCFRTWIHLRFLVLSFKGERCTLEYLCERRSFNNYTGKTSTKQTVEVNQEIWLLYLRVHTEDFLTFSKLSPDTSVSLSSVLPEYLECFSISNFTKFCGHPYHSYFPPLGSHVQEIKDASLHFEYQAQSTYLQGV